VQSQNGTETKKNCTLCSYISTVQWKIFQLCWQIATVFIVLKPKILKIFNTTGLRLLVCYKFEKSCLKTLMVVLRKMPKFEDKLLTASVFVLCVSYVVI
jgi:hypothetical protein